MASDLTEALCVFLAGLAQYSGDPKTEWHLNAHRTRASLLEAVANLPYKGGNTLTGTVLNLQPQPPFRDCCIPLVTFKGLSCSSFYWLFRRLLKEVTVHKLQNENCASALVVGGWAVCVIARRWRKLNCMLHYANKTELFLIDSQCILSQSPCSLAALLERPPRND